MIIGFDGKRAIENNTGLGNYSRLLVEVLSAKYPDNKYLLYAPSLKENPRLKRLLEQRNVDIVTPDTAFGRTLRSVWRSSGVTPCLRRDKVDLYHGLSGELPVNIGGFDGPTVLTIHDVIFRRFPECYKLIDRKIYDYKFGRSALEATRIIAISERTKKDIIEYYDIPEDKIDVVYQGCHPQFHGVPSAEEIERVKKKYGLDNPYIISVGTIETRKNQAMAVRGIRGLPDEIDLVLVGRRTPYAKTLDGYISTYSIESRVKFIENADFADLPALYAGAFCSSYTSRYEGFGIPVIESLSVGTPVVVATGSCLEEAAGPSAPAVDPDDVEEWLNTVKEMVNYPSVRAKIAREGMEFVKRFNDDDMASRTMAAYTRAIEEYNR
ncbi:MAG: glycosyltransferase family 4 protein [Muribaculaceae bacterium]|nr:glycosyltransferase family 4 protein [Muribaculaceae bacterium]